MIRNKLRIKNGFFSILILSCICFFVAIDTASAQTGAVIMPTRETTIKTALDELQHQTGYKIFLNWDEIDPNRKVFLSANQMTAKGLLKEALSGAGFGWEMSDDRIVVFREEKKQAPDNGRGARSVMNRNGFDAEQMTYVPDPWSRTQKPFKEMASTRKSYWDNDSKGHDSLGMAVVNYRVNSSVIEPGYMDNIRTLEIIRRTMTNKKVLASLDYIVITAGSSPEGNTAANEKLAADRARAMKTYLMWKYPFLERDIIYTFSIGEDWSGLCKMVEEDYGIPHKDEVLHIIESPSSSDTKRALLKQVGGGTAWRYISRNMLPKLRGAAAITLHYKEELEPIIIEHTDTVYVDRVEECIIEREIVVEVPVVNERVWERKPLFALKTNLLFDAASALNVEIEIPIGNRWSLAGEWVFPWWLWEDKQIALETGMATLELRYWLGDRCKHRQLNGWFLGVHGGAGYYDLEWKTIGYQGEFWYAGLSGGYAHQISKNGNWRMEYSLGVGYMETKYREYVPKFGTDNEWHLIRQNNGRTTWLGPTRAKISLVFMINHGYQERKEVSNE